MDQVPLSCATLSRPKTTKVREMCVWVRPHPYLLPDGRDLRSVSEEFRLPVPAAMIGELNMTAILIITALYGIVIGLCTGGISQRAIEYVCHRKGLAGPSGSCSSYCG